MKVYPTDHIRNLAVVGHGDAGKTQLLSSLLHVAGATPRWGKVDEGTTVADCALVVVHAVKGVEVQTEKTWAYANEFMVPRMMVINQMDREHANFGAALDSARSTFSRAIVPCTLPIGQEAGFRGVVNIVHMKAYEFDAAGKPKEIPIPETGRDV